MFQVKTQTYGPSNYTLYSRQQFRANIDSFGTCKKWTRKNPKKHTNSEVKMPSFARKKQPTFDKENLLEQIRMQKQKFRAAQTSTCNLVRPDSKPKLRLIRPGTAEVKVESQNKLVALRREVESLALKISEQKDMIDSLKRSKKYNRYLELKSISEVYLSQISELRIKIRSYGHELRQKQKIRDDRHNRDRNIKEMNKVVENRLDKENIKLVQAIQDICFQIQDHKLKLHEQKKEKERLLKDIYQLQNKTGKIYIMPRVQAQSNEQDPLEKPQIQSMEEKCTNNEEQLNDYEGEPQNVEENSSDEEYSEDYSEEEESEGEAQRRTLSY